MSLNWRQFELGILRPTLEGEAEVAIKLVGETIWHESDRLQALGQYGARANGERSLPFGPGLGIASIEEATWDWMMTKLAFRQAVDKGSSGDNASLMPEYSELAWDLRLNVLACRFRYKVDKRPLPVLEGGVEARAEYWFKVYNGSGVAERVQLYISNALDIKWVK